jgi:hypothetical protein
VYDDRIDVSFYGTNAKEQVTIEKWTEKLCQPVDFFTREVMKEQKPYPFFLREVIEQMDLIPGF